MSRLFLAENKIKIPLMENKMKWKKKKHPVIEIDMSSANNDGQMAEDRTSAIPTLQVQSSKQDAGSPSPRRRFQDHGINLHSGDSGIESVQVSPAQKASSSAIDMYDVPGPSNFVYLHPDRARFNHFNTIASSSREHNTIEVPTLKEWQKIQLGFNEIWNFPGCCGAIDGKHIVIKAPPSAGSEYYNYKGTNSIVLLGIVDHNYCFSYIDVGSYGRNADGGVFQQCNIYPLLENESLLPKGGVLVGDDAFPLKTYLMKPYSKINLTKEERVYNYRTSRARRIVENGFGILASRFRIFGQPIAVKVETTIKIVKATCAIHNWLRLTTPASYTPPGCYDYEDIVNSTIVQGEWRSEISKMPSILRTRNYNRPKKIAQQVRETYKEYFNGEWAVEWQDRMI